MITQIFFMRWDVSVNREILQQQLETVFVMLCAGVFKQLQQLNGLTVDDDKNNHKTAIVKHHTTQESDDMPDQRYVLDVVGNQEQFPLDSKQQQWQLFYDVCHTVMPILLLSSFAQYKQNALMSKSPDCNGFCGHEIFAKNIL